MTSQIIFMVSWFLIKGVHTKFYDNTISRFGNVYIFNLNRSLNYVSYGYSGDDKIEDEDFG